VIVKSGNMSLGVTLLAALVERAAKALPGYDVEILEMHHKLKVDAPSGTALLLGEAAAKGRGVKLEKKCLARTGRRNRAAQGRRHRLCQPQRRFGGGRASGFLAAQASGCLCRTAPRIARSLPRGRSKQPAGVKARSPDSTP